MLIGFARKKDGTDGKVPVFIPSHLTCYVGPDAYEAVLNRPVEGLESNKRDEPTAEILVGPETDLLAEIKAALAVPGTLCCVKMERPDEELVGRVSKSFPDESIYVFSPELSPLSALPVSSIETFGKSEDECFEDFVGDVTGTRPRKANKAKKEAYSSHLSERPSHPVYEPIPVPKSAQNPNQNGKDAADSGSIPNRLDLPSREAVKARLKRDMPNIAFALVFVLLCFSASLGYFLLSSSSNVFFEVTCLFMVILFPILSCVPIGFLYSDNGSRLRNISLPLFYYFAVHIALTILCAFIILALGNGFGWDGGKTTLYFFMNLMPVVWMFARIFADPWIKRWKSRRNRE